MINDISVKEKLKMRKPNVNVGYNSWIVELSGRRLSER